MKSKLLAIICLMISATMVYAQSATTEALQKKHSNSLTLFFYNNTLRMINQTEDKEFDELIKDIEKMRFLMIKKEETNFGGNDYKKLVSDYKSESFEEVMTSRHEGKNFNVYLKEAGGKTKGMLVLVNDDDNLYVLDILGRIALNKVTTFYNKLDESSDIGSQIRKFVGDKDDDRGSGNDKEDHNHKGTDENH